MVCIVYYYPRVVGNSVGLPGIWVLFTVLVGGGVFGIFGMLVGIPIASVAYCLFKDAVSSRLKKQNISEEQVDAAGEEEPLLLEEKEIERPVPKRPKKFKIRRKKK